MDDDLWIDFLDSDNPFVDLTQHLEGLGYQRTAQDISSDNAQFVTYEKGTQSVKATLARNKRRWHAVLKLRSAGD